MSEDNSISGVLGSWKLQPEYLKLRTLKELLDETGHYITTRNLRYLCIKGEIEATQTPGGMWVVHKDEARRVLATRGGKPSREKPNKPRVDYDRDQEYYKSIQRRYNLSREEYDRMVAEQGGKCAICGVDPITFTHLGLNNQRLCVDHWHDDYSNVRGLLCSNCNFGIGRWLDRPELLKAAIRYIDRHAHLRCVG